MKMDREIKARWVAALRSGKYKQGWGHLSAGGRYCCLGVLCELAIESGDVDMEKQPDGGKRYGYEVIRYDGSTMVLPPSVTDWSGIGRTRGPIFSTEEGYTYSFGESFLAELNDDERDFTFDQIADVIDYFA